MYYERLAKTTIEFIEQKTWESNSHEIKLSNWNLRFAINEILRRQKNNVNEKRLANNVEIYLLRIKIKEKLNNYTDINEYKESF